MAEKKYLNYEGLQDVAGHVNTRLKTVTSIPVSADNGAVRLYVGTTTATYIQGHIYQYNSTDLEWVDITSSYTAGNGINIENNEISADTVIFTGTQEEWDILTTVQKQQYDICNITDDMSDFDGGGSSTLAGLSDVDIDTSTLADGQILQYDASSQKWVNASGAVSPSKTVTVYSAANDTLTYSDLTGTKTVTTDANGVGTADIVCFDNTSITFTSSVAKNPSNLSSDYSKTVNITSSTTAIYVMPDDVLYWYGYKSNNLEECSSTNGWTNTGYTFVAPTYNTNYVVLNSNGINMYSALGTKTEISGTKFKAISQGITIGGTAYGYAMYEPTKSLSSSYTVIGEFENNSIAYTEYNMADVAKYYSIHSDNSRKINLYAIWYE